MVFGLIAELSLSSIWFITKNVASGAYWLAFGSPPSESKVLLEKVKALEEREKELQELLTKKLSTIEELLLNQKN